MRRRVRDEPFLRIFQNIARRLDGIHQPGGFFAGVKFRLKRRVKKMNVCTRCESTMDRRTSIPEGAGRRYWGDVEPYVYVGDSEIHHFICTSCGNLTAIQFREAA